MVVASGHYHACRIPDIEGLKEWKERWPGRVQHSKSYRHPRGFRDQVRDWEGHWLLRLVVDVTDSGLLKECSSDWCGRLVDGYCA